MKITVCQLNNRPEALAPDWQKFVSHVHEQGSELVLLPEMPFSPWVARTREMNPEIWQKAVTAHEDWQGRFQELAPAVVLGTRPIVSGDQRFNEAFVWDVEQGFRSAHLKTYLPDEEGFWEASWYHRGNADFSTIDAGPARVGFLVCTELWFMQHARTFGQAGAHLIACPRATPRTTLDKWLAGGRAASVISGAFCLSSNLVTPGGSEELGGQGWIISPDGDVLALTSRQQPFISLDIDLLESESAKQTYPRYVPD